MLTEVIVDPMLCTPPVIKTASKSGPFESLSKLPKKSSFRRTSENWLKDKPFEALLKLPQRSMSSSPTIASPLQERKRDLENWVERDVRRGGVILVLLQ
jgi:hypothetical protein